MVDLLQWLFGRAFANGLFKPNAGTYRKVYRHQRNPALNRSKHWPYARSYAEARLMSPSHRPVA